MQPAASASLIIRACRARSFMVYSWMAWAIGPMEVPAVRMVSIR